MREKHSQDVDWIQKGWIERENREIRQRLVGERRVRHIEEREDMMREKWWRVEE